MSLLKSAWEIALERTEGIQADPEKIKKDSVLKEGRRLAGAFLLGNEPEEQTVDQAYHACDPQDKNLMREGIATTVLLNIALPQSPDYFERFDRMIQLVTLIAEKNDGSAQLFDQIRNFLEQYLSSRDSLMERMKQQYQSTFDKKQEQLMQKYGKGINISIEQDPEYIQLIQRGYAQLSAQYQQVLDQAKDQLKELWSLNL